MIHIAFPTKSPRRTTPVLQHGAMLIPVVVGEGTLKTIEHMIIGHQHSGF